MIRYNSAERIKVMTPRWNWRGKRNLLFRVQVSTGEVVVTLLLRSQLIGRPGVLSGSYIAYVFPSLRMGSY